MVKWEKETAYTGDNLYFDWVTSWLNPVANVAAAPAPSDVAAANHVLVKRERRRLTNRRIPQQALPETAGADQQPSETAAVFLAIPGNAAADQQRSDQQRSDTPAAAQAASETAAAGQLLSENAAAAELPIHTDSEPVHTASAPSESLASVEDSDGLQGSAVSTADLDCGLDKIYIMGCAGKESSMNVVSSDEPTADEAILRDIYDHHIVDGKSGQNERGATVMMQSIPYRLQVEPDLLDLLRQTCEMDHVEYIYIPTCTEGINCRSGASRNKGYCFVHFSVAATAEEFASRTHGHVFPSAPGEKRVITSMAKFQGLYTNLMNVLEIHAKKWRPKNGFAHIRTSKGELVCVGLLPLRNLVKRRATRPNNCQVGKQKYRFAQSAS
jgi:CDGSH-type Zn-finger protein